MNRLVWLLLLTVGVFGCSGSNENEANKEGGSSTVVLDGMTDRETVEGRWQLLMYSEAPGQITPTPMTIALVEVKKSDSNYEAEIIDRPEKGPQMQLDSSKCSATKLSLSMQMQGAPYVFNGELKDSRLRGSVLAGGVVAVPAELIATNSLVIEENAPIAAQTEFEDATRTKDPISAFMKFAEDYPKNPLSLFALEFAIRGTAPDTSEDEVAKRVQNYRELSQTWGAELDQTAVINSIFSLARSGAGPETAKALLTELKKSTGEDASPQLEQIVTVAESQVQLSEAGNLLKSKSDETAEKGVELLKKLIDENPFQFDAIMMLGDHLSSRNNPDEAIEWYGRLAMLPGYEMAMVQQMGEKPDYTKLPSERCRMLWEAKYGTMAGLEERMMKLYRRTVSTIGVSSEKISSGGSRASVCELFTGGSCPPCVAADVATGVIEQNFPENQVFVLRYHQHIPAPDPMVCPDGESRFDYYNGTGTPSLRVNGQDVRGSGPIVNSTAVYEELASLIKPLVEEDSEISIDLSAEVEGSVVKFRAAATGPESFGETIRLRLVVAEDEIIFPSTNGIMVHDMIVRDMPTGPNGVAPKDGKLKYHGRVDMLEVRQKLIDYLSRFESGRQFNFPVKPLDFGSMHVIAMVQDDETKEILQASRIAFDVVVPPLTKPEDEVGDDREEKKDSSAEAPAGEGPAKSNEEAGSEPAGKTADDDPSKGSENSTEKKDEAGADTTAGPESTESVESEKPESQEAGKDSPEASSEAGEPSQPKEPAKADEAG